MVASVAILEVGARLGEAMERMGSSEMLKKASANFIVRTGRASKWDCSWGDERM